MATLPPRYSHPRSRSTSSGMGFFALVVVAILGVIIYAIFAGGHGPAPAFMKSAYSADPGTAAAAQVNPSAPFNPGSALNQHLVSHPTPKPFDGTDIKTTFNVSRPGDDAPGFFTRTLNYLRIHLPFTNSHRTSWTLDDLRIARGYVAEAHDGLLFVNCQTWAVVQDGDRRLHAGDDFSQSPVLGIGVNADEMARFGSLKAVSANGTLVSSPYNPRMWDYTRYLDGPVILENCPGHAGQYIKVVVAPDDTMEYQTRLVDRYTGTFHLPGGEVQPGAWMWQGKGQGPLDRNPDAR